MPQPQGLQRSDQNAATPQKLPCGRSIPPVGSTGRSSRYILRYIFSGRKIMQGRRIFFGILVALLLAGLVAVVGLTAYNAGIAQGAIASGVFVQPSTDGTGAPNAPLYLPFGGYHPFGYYRPFGFGFGVLGCLVPIFFFLLLFALFRFAFRPRWGRGWGGPGLRSRWDPSQGDIPPGVKEWHRRLHKEEGDTPPPTPTAPSA